MTPILLLHGALGSSTQLKLLQEALSQEGFAVYTLNFSGHSGVDFKTSFGIEAFADDVKSFIEENGFESIHCFGYSMGGYVALYLALNYPALLGKIITLGTKFDWSVESAEKEVKKMNPEKVIEKIPAFARILKSRHAPVDWKLLMNKTADMMLRLGQDPLLKPMNLRLIQNQILLLLGDQDDMADLQYTKEVAEYLGAARFMSLENTPHPIEKVNISILTSEIVSFIRN